MGNNNLVIGNVGTVSAKGKKVEISNSDISAKSKMGNGNVVVGRLELLFLVNRNLGLKTQ